MELPNQAGATPQESNIQNTSLSQELSPPQKRSILSRRFIAASIDGLVIYLLPIVWLFYTIYTKTPQQRLGFFLNFEVFIGQWPFIIATFIALAYNIFALAKFGTTIGKHYMGLRVQSIPRGNLTILQATIRESIKWLPNLLFPLAFYVVAASAYFNKYGQGLHDRLAKTLVLEASVIKRINYSLGIGLVIVLPLLLLLGLTPLITPSVDLLFSKEGFKVLLSQPQIQKQVVEENKKLRDNFPKAVSKIDEFVSKNNQVPTSEEYNTITSSQFNFYYRLCDSLGKYNVSLLVVPLQSETPQELESGKQSWLIYRSKVGKIEEVVASEEPLCLRDEDKQTNLKEAVNRLEQYKSKNGSYPSEGEINLLNSFGIIYNEFHGYKQCVDSGKQVFVLALILEESNNLLTYRSASNSYQTSDVPKTVRGMYPPLNCP